MAANVEIKARARDMARQQALARELAGGAEPLQLHQHDTFFVVPRGRLKLRVQGHRAELIFYQRPDAEGPKTSHYQLVPAPDPDGLRQALAAALGVLGTVRKQRLVYLAGRTRIHLDRVQGLGEYIELEVMLDQEEDDASGEAEARRLMQALEIRPQELVQGAYLDLLVKDGPSAGGREFTLSERAARRES